MTGVGDGSVSEPKISQSTVEKYSEGHFLFSLWSSKDAKIVVSAAALQVCHFSPEFHVVLMQYRTDAFEVWLTHWLRSSLANSREETCWPFSSTASQD